MSNILSDAQKEQFIRDGYVAVSGLIPEEIVAATCDAICNSLNISVIDAATWPTGDRAVPWDAAELTQDCRTEKMDDAAQELVGDVLMRQMCISSVLDMQGKPPYIKGFIPVLAFPREGEKRYDAENHKDGFHVDGIHFVTLWPEKILLVALVYLTDTETYGGATVVRPGSHRQIFEHWAKLGQQPTANETMADLEYSLPTAVPGKAGDVIFMHHLMVHSGSSNHDNHVRVAINANFTTDLAKPYEPKTGAPGEDWTPLDWTLRTDNLPEAKVAVPASV